MSRIEDIRAWFSELSLATKCLLLFGGASALIITIALSLPLLRMNGLVGQGELELARAVYSAWLKIEDTQPSTETDGDSPTVLSGVTVRIEPAGSQSQDDRFLSRAEARFAGDTDRVEHFDADWSGWNRVYRYARARRGPDGSLREIVVLEHRADGAAGRLVVNLLYVLAAGAVVLAVALVVFATLTSRLILRPVLSLQRTAERVREGHLDTRSHIDTGDEFEELAETINLMLTELQRQQEELVSANAAMDLKLSELTEANVALFESARLKGEFLASVSHELRTPLNAIIGFAELLLELARADLVAMNEPAEPETRSKRGKSRESAAEPTRVDSESLAKRERYLVNIVSAGRTLLEMIETLLEMAKIEAGRIEINPGPVVLAEACQALAGLIHPLARKKSVDVVLDLHPEVEVIQTDSKKFHQIIFNLLSNAVKFTGEGDSGGTNPPRVTLRTEPLREGGDEPGRVRISIIDTGPGIAPEDQKRIFDKFQQVDASHTRSHTGTGLGLAIVAELTRLLQGEVQLESELGQGSMFSVILPVQLDVQMIEEAKLEAKFRGSLAGRDPVPSADRGSQSASPPASQGEPGQPQPETARS